MAYKAEVIDRFENSISETAKINVGTLDKNSMNVGTALVGAPACGDVMKFQIEVEESEEEYTDESGAKLKRSVKKIKDAKFKTFGCGSAIASSHYLAELVRGMNINEAEQIKNSSIAESLSLPPVKIHCSVLAEEAIKGAIQDYKNKHAN